MMFQDVYGIRLPTGQEGPKGPKQLQAVHHSLENLSGGNEEMVEEMV
jgi:hypothetical protein